MSEIILDKTGIYRRTVTMERLSIKEDEIFTKIGNVTIACKDLFFNGSVTYIDSTTGFIHTAIVIDHVNISTEFELDTEDKFIFPCFEKRSDSAKIKNVKWYIPNNCIGCLIVEFRNTGVMKLYMVFIDNKDGQYYRPPLSNIHTDGKVCMGDGNYPNAVRDGQGAIIESCTYKFYNNDFNGDLKPPDSKIKELFKFDGETLEQKFTKRQTTWTKHCDKISNIRLNPIIQNIWERANDDNRNAQRREIFISNQ